MELLNRLRESHQNSQQRALGSDIFLKAAGRNVAVTR